MNTTLPPRPCASICLPAARAISQDWVTFTSITSLNASGGWSTILETLLMPAASTRMSTPPKRLTAASTTFSQLAAELGRMLMVSTVAPSVSHAAATSLRASSPPAASARLQPAPASTLEASAPNAPEAPVTMAVLPRMSNSARGFLRKSSDMWVALACSPDEAIRAFTPVFDGLRRNPGTAAPALRKRSMRATGSAGRPASLHGRDRDRDGADLVAAIDDLAVLVGADVATVALAHDRLLAADDHGELARKHVVDLLGRRGVGTGTAARQEVRDAENQRLRAAHLGPEHPQRFVVAVIGRLIGFRLRQFPHDHQNFSPFSIR